MKEKMGEDFDYLAFRQRTVDMVEEYTGKKAVVVCEADVKKSDNGFYDISPVSRSCLIELAWLYDTVAVYVIITI